MAFPPTFLVRTLLVSRTLRVLLFDFLTAIETGRGPRPESPRLSSRLSVSLKLSFAGGISRCPKAIVKLLQSIYHHRSPPKAAQAPESAVRNCSCAIATGQAGRAEDACAELWRATSLV